ncbi:MAG: DUF5301 domain-containing protein [Clostridiales bacterium]|jgi:beta-lactamase regulating signal transducer with metallopeptidase domain|nr:DUF5301 domain-containing protein [Clostridiales bacterium]
MIDEKLYAEALRTLIVMTASGSVVALLLFALKPLIKNRLPKSAQYYLWLVVVAALLVPVPLIIRVPQYAEHVPAAAVYDAVRRNVITTEEELDRIQRAAAESPLVTDFSSQQSPIAGAVDILSIVYPFGAAGVLFYHILAYALFSRKIRRRNVPAGIDCRIRVYRNAKAATPMLIGLFSPAVVLPDREYTDEQLRAVLLHELTHLRRKDILVKWLSVLACAAHWFNPIVWLTRREIDRACELSCDEAVIRGLDANGRRSYGDTLLYVAADPGGAANKTSRAALSVTMCEEKKDLKERLLAIMRSKKRGRAAAAASAAVIIAAVLIACALGAGSGETLVLPPADDVSAILMNQYNLAGIDSDNDGPVGRITVTDKDEIKTILSAISGSEQTRRQSVNDNPSLSDDDRYLELWLDESRKLCLYVENGVPYIEEPYIAIYRAKSDFQEIYGIYAYKIAPSRTFFLENATEKQKLDRMPSVTLNADGTAELGMAIISSYIPPRCTYAFEGGELTLRAVVETEHDESFFGLKNGDEVARFAVVDDSTITFKSAAIPLFADEGARYALAKKDGFEARVLADFAQREDLPWDRAIALDVPEYPGVKFEWTSEKLTADGEEIMSGMPIWNLYLADVTGDGNPDFCATVSFGSGIVDTRILAYDYAGGKLYSLSDRAFYDYSLSLGDGRLIVTQTNGMFSGGDEGERLETGILAIVDGELTAIGIDRTTPEPEAVPPTESPRPAYVALNGYIGNFDAASGTFGFDEVQWLDSVNDADYLREIGADPDSLPNGFYIYNPDDDFVLLTLAEDAVFFIIDGAESRQVDRRVFAENLNRYAPDFQTPYIVEFVDGKSDRAAVIRERYVP